MNKFITSLAIATGSLTMLSIMSFEDILHISPRYHAGTIQADVARVQTYTLSDGTTHVITRGVDPIRYEKNMRAIRAHVTCVDTPDLCGKVLN